jgi:monofunctional chorismate mutase
MSVPGQGWGIAAVRGAIDVPANTARDIQERTALLLQRLIETNRLDPSRIVSALFTTTADLDADFPAHAARRLGWTEVPMLHAREIPVPGSMPRVVRVLLTVSGVSPGTRLKPVYVDGAAALRPDLTGAPTPPPAGPARRVAIVGLGQIGGSIGLALGRAASRGRWVRAGFDLDPAAIAAARAGGAIDEAADSLAAACAGAEIAVLAVPVDALPAAIDAAAATLPRGAALIDTGSARAGVTAALERAAARGLLAVGGHPIAGTEGHGFAAARASLFDGAPFALCPAGAAVPALVRQLITDLGARALEVDPASHDRALARTSHLPWVLACALRDLGERFAGLGLAGPGFRDMTRLAGSDPRMASAFGRANAREIAAAWHELRDDIERRVAALERPTGA